MTGHKTPEQIADQRAKGWTDWHPEDYCHKCGQRNIKGWYADSALWNRAAPVEAIWCPQCFVEAYEQATGEKPIWRLAPAELSDERSALIKSEAAMRHRLADAERTLGRARSQVHKLESADYGRGDHRSFPPRLGGVVTDLRAEMVEALARAQARQTWPDVEWDSLYVEIQESFRRGVQAQADAVLPALQRAVTTARERTLREAIESIRGALLNDEEEYKNVSPILRFLETRADAIAQAIRS